MKSSIIAIGTANPDYCFDQQLISEFMSRAARLSPSETTKLKALYRASGIGKRYSVIPDFGGGPENYSFFPTTPDMEPFPSVKDRMQLYKKEALPLAIRAIDKCLKSAPDLRLSDITHLITVSCTGMYAPGLDIEIVQALNLSPGIQRTCINYMGCYAAFNALKAADAFCKADPDTRVLIVCVELCTIHFQKSKDPDHLLSNALFSDGASAAIVSPEGIEGKNLELSGFHCDLEPQGKKDMTWHISDFGFEMTLSSYVPELIRSGISNLTKKLLERLSSNQESISLLAIHPGGKRILEVIEEELKFPKIANLPAYKVLKEYGNMSSATLFFVLKELLKTLTQEDSEKNVLSFAFGPGLTLESMILKVKVTSTLHTKSIYKIFHEDSIYRS